jgi:hypothetical protein
MISNKPIMELNDNDSILAITIIGSESNEKKDIIRSMFNINLDTNEGYNLITDKDRHILIKDYDSDTFTIDIIDDYIDNKIITSSKTKISNDSPILYWLVSDIIIYVIQVNDIISSNMFNVLDQLKSRQYNQKYNDPYIVFIFINNKEVLDDEIGNELCKYDFIKGSYSINTLTKDNIKYEVLRDILNKAIGSYLIKYEDNRLSIRYDVWYNSFQYITKELSNNNKIMKDTILNNWNRSIYESCIKEFNNLVLIHEKTDKYKIVNDQIINDIILRYNISACLPYDTKYRSLLLQGICSIIRDHKRKVNHNILLLKCNIVDRIEKEYRELILTRQHYDIVNLIELYYNKLTNDKDINIDWKLIIEDIYNTDYKKCTKSCKRGEHYCYLVGEHYNHKFKDCTYSIDCKNGCGDVKVYPCSEYPKIYTCKKLIKCSGSCNQSYEGSCNITEWHCDNYKVLNCINGCDKQIISCSLDKYECIGKDIKCIEGCNRLMHVNCNINEWKCTDEQLIICLSQPFIQFNTL